MIQTYPEVHKTTKSTPDCAETRNFYLGWKSLLYFIWSCASWQYWVWKTKTQWWYLAIEHKLKFSSFEFYMYVKQIYQKKIPYSIYLFNVKDAFSYYIMLFSSFLNSQQYWNTHI